MTRVFKLILFFFFLCAAAGVSGANETQVLASVDRTAIGINDELRFSLTFSDASLNIPNIQLPELPDFIVASTARSQSTSIVNGRASSQVSITFTLLPKTAGRFTIPAMFLQLDGKTHKTEPIQIEVTQNSAQTNQPAGRAARPAGSTDSKNIYVTASVDKLKPFVNEQVIYTFKLFQKINTLSQPRYVPANFSGFWIEAGGAKNYYTTIGGERYLVNEITTYLFPTKSGQITIAKSAIETTIEDRSSGNPFGDDFFRGFFGGGRNVTLESEAIPLSVKPLPIDGRPAEGADAVGQFKISAKIDKQTLKTNEALTLSITISGTGNFKAMETPKLQPTDDFRMYENASTLTADNQGSAPSGSKVFSIVLVPTTPGKKQIPPLSFSYFDPQSASYKTISTQSFYVDVAQGSEPPQEIVSPAAAKPQEIKVLNADIRYIKTTLKHHKPGNDLLKNPLFVFGNFIPFLIVGWAFFYSRFSDRIRADSGFARKLIASKEARKYLKNAKRLLIEGQQKQYSLAVSKAIVEYIAHKFNVSADGLTLFDISSLLKSKNITEDDIIKIKEILEESDMVRFSPAAVSLAAMKSMYVKAGALLSALEKKI